MNITLRNIHKHFGRIHANKNISIAFAEGQIVGVLGENGAGKSTLMKILAGYQPADSGEILIDDRPVHYRGPQAALSQGIGMLQQDPLDIGAFTVLENFVYGRRGRLIPDWKESEQQLVSYAKRFQFSLEPEMPVDNLSIAQRQQLEIVRLLASGVRALILDEPTTGISAEQKTTLFEALRNLARDDRLIVLLVSHKLEDVIDLCDSVEVLRQGEHVGNMVMPDSQAITTSMMSETKARLVQMMFGQELPVQSRPPVVIGAPAIRLKDVYARSRRLELSRIQLEVRRGEVIGLAGLDGSGQELMMRAMCGLSHIAGGHIEVGDQNLTGKSYRQFMRNGVVFGAAGRIEEGLIAGLTLTEHTALVSADQPVINWHKMDRKTSSLITRYNVRGGPGDFIEQLSGGNQQRVLLALLPENARLLILEQPTRGLDVDSARWIWQQLLERRNQGTAIVFSSAELDELVAYSDRILVFYAGRIHEVPDVAAISIDRLGHLIGGEFQ